MSFVGSSIGHIRIKLCSFKSSDGLRRKKMGHTKTPVGTSYQLIDNGCMCVSSFRLALYIDWFIVDALNSLHR